MGAADTSDRPRQPQWARRCIEVLAHRSPSDVTGVWLEVAQSHTRRRTPTDVLRRYGDDRFCAPSPVDLRASVRLDQIALEAAADFEGMLLSPVAPLGTCSVVAPTSQNRTVSANRALEVVSDPTNVMALECARRLLATPTTDVRLCTVHQVLRAQSVGPDPGRTQHFRMFAMVEAGRGRADDGFELDAVARHVGTYDRLFDACTKRGYVFARRKAIIHAAARETTLKERIEARLRSDFGHIEVTSSPLTNPYYDGLRVTFGATSPSGDFVPIADLGRFDWMQQLTSNRRFRFIASGLGIQLFELLFKTT